MAAQAASCGHARDVHLDLAKRYSLKLRLIEALCLDVPDSTAEAAPAQAIVQHEARVSARR